MEGSNPLWSQGAPRSDETPASCSASANRRWGALARKPAVLAAAGALLLAAGMLCLVLPLALGPGSGVWHEPDGAPATGDVDVPLPDEAPADGSAGRLAECRTALRDPEQYTAAALAAEQAVFGGAAGGLPGGGASRAAAVLAGLAALPRLQVPLVFWVLHSDAHPYSEHFAAAATTQVTLLNAAFQRSGIQFSLAALIPVAASSEAVEGCAAPSSAVDRLLPSTDRAISVVLCVPEGVWGQTAVLEGPLEGGGAAGALRILLRRAALWQSRTSLVHQMGHFLGLAHPFPDGSHGRGSCEEGGADGDGIPDTPRQYAPNSGCSLDGGMHVCRGEDGPLPVNNLMDHTNDTCRWLFTPGQLARMRAMTQLYRPQLYESAVRGYALRPLPFGRAFQTGLPPLAVLRAQQAAALAAAASDAATGGGGDSSSSSSSEAAAANLSAQLNGLADSFGQAALAAASGSGPQLPTAVHRCSCLGPDAHGRTAWVGELAEAGAVDAVRVLWRAAPSAEPPGDDSSSCGGAADMGTGLLCGSQQQGEPAMVDIRVGYSPDPQQNARCTAGPVPLTSPLQQVECEAPLEGQFMSLEVVSSPPGSGIEPAASSPAAASAAVAARAAPCLCAVQPLSYLSGPLPADDDAAAAGPVLHRGEWWQAQQSSSARSALSALRLLPAAGAAPSCSSTGAELQPWWALEAGLDTIAVRGLRLSLPSACPAAAYSPHAAAAAAACAASSTTTTITTTSSSSRTCSTSRSEGRGGTLGLGESLCRPPQPLNLTVLVGSSLEELLGLAGDALAGAAGRVCVRNATLLPGQLADVDCGRLMHGSVVLVRAHLPAPTALELCGVEVLGAVELQLREALTGGKGEVEPTSLRPYFALPLDGDEATCLSTSSQASSWTLPLQGLHTVLGLRVTATGSNATASLLDSGGRPLWSAQLRGLSASGVAQAVDLQVPASVGSAAAVALHNFSSLCEARLFATSTTARSSRPILPRPPTPAPTALASNFTAAEASPGGGGGDSTNSGGSGRTSAGSSAAAWWALSASGLSFDAAVDGNYRTCAGSVAGEQPWAVLSLGGAFRVEAVTLVADREQLNLTLHTLPPGGLARFLSALGLPLQPANGSAEAAAGDSPAVPAGEAGLAPAAGEAAGAEAAAPAPAEEGSGPAPDLASALELAGTEQCAAGVAVERWAATQVWCQGTPVAEGLVVVSHAGSGADGSSPGPAGLRLCEVGLLGRVAATP